MNDTATPRAAASSLLASFFYEIVCEEGIDFGSFESRCISLGHSVIADAMSMALEMFVRGVVPDGEVESKQVLVEADGAWVRLQGAKEGGPERVEIKALVAYGAKEEVGRRVRRLDCVHHGCVASPDAFWTQGIAVIGAKFDLSKVKTCHLGVDGEGWCVRGAEFFPARVKSTGHLDPFHVNRAVLSCFGKDNARGAWHVLDALNDGDKEEACKLLELMRDYGIARGGRSTEAVGYLRNNIDLIAVEGPSLGAMEPENQHLYGARMDSAPCAWSRPGASSMARVVSRRRSHREIPRMTRSRSLTPKRAEQREAGIIKALWPKGAGRTVESIGSGYLPPHQASLVGMAAEVRHAAGIDSGMIPMQG